ncbi:MAG: DUF3501 family protein [Gammaproteobacteria bacterium]|nr:DUF3501 family protein [Gammaproteobacteria bacterium]
MLKRDDLLSLESYSDQREAFREKVMAHKKNRQLKLGENATLYFEDRLTMQYQIQEMLRVERIFDAEGIQEELDTYNALIPDGCNWKATFMLEYVDENERKAALAKMIGIEDKVWMQVAGHERIYAIADEDLERDNAEKTSAVHFMRFELSSAMAEAVKLGANIGAGIEHTAYDVSIEALPANIRDSLAADLN